VRGWYDIVGEPRFSSLMETQSQEKTQAREDYRAAATRHYQDAELLMGHARRDNADHHYGFAAECVLKTLLEQMGNLREEHRHWHINVLWNKMQISRFQNAFPGLAQLLTGGNRFADWDVAQRYAEDGAISSETLARHQDYARRLLIAAGVSRG
jgi:hypothetical protein